jgi:hypothetical protein
MKDTRKIFGKYTCKIQSKKENLTLSTRNYFPCEGIVIQHLSIIQRNNFNLVNILTTFFLSEITITL